MKILSKLLIAILIGGFSGIIITSCDTGNTLVAPGNISQVSIQLVFPEQPEIIGLNKTNIIDEVTVSVVDFATIDLLAGEVSNKPAVLINEQPLQIVQTAEGRFAEGVLDIPLTDATQKFQIIVFASDVQNRVFLSGSSEIELEQGQSDEPTVTVLMGQAVSITSFGTPSASSTFTPGDFGPENGNDLDFGTSWFSAGPAADPAGSVYTWTASQNQFIGTMGVVNNSEHNNPQFRSGFGFDEVNYKVFSGPNATGDLLFDQTIDYPKTAAEPVFRVSPFVIGQSVELTLTGHESETCGGFSELLIVNPLISVNTPDLESIEIQPRNGFVRIGESFAFSVTGHYSGNISIPISNQITWSTDDISIAEIDQQGNVTPVSTGRTNVRAMFDNVFATTTITVGAEGSALLSNLQVDLTQLNPGSFHGYSIQFDYNDPNGDVNENIIVFVTGEFQPSGTFDFEQISDITKTGDGNTGTITFNLGISYGSSSSVDLTCQLQDSGGILSELVTINVPNPEPAGGTSMNKVGLLEADLFQ